MANNDFKASTFDEDSDIEDDKSIAFGTSRDIEIEYDSTDDSLKVTKATKTMRLDSPDDFSLVGHWPLNEGSGTTAKDISLQGNDGTITAGAGGYSADSPFRQSYDFDGADTKIDCGSPAILDDIEKLTAMAWVKADGLGEGSVSFIFGKSNWRLHVQATEEIAFLSTRASVNGVWSSNSNALPPGGWHLVTVVYDRSDVANDPVFYVDGQPITVNEDTTPVGAATSDAASNFIIGNNTGQTRTFDGRIAEVKVWNRLLSAREVHQFYVAASESPTFQAISVLADITVAGATIKTPVTITTDTTPTAVNRSTIIIGTWTAANDITDFDNESEGQEILVIGGDTDCNIVDGAPIALVGGTTWNAAAGAAIALYNTGGVWYEKWRSAT